MRSTRAIAALLLAGQASCMTGPRLVSDAPKDYLIANNPERVWVTLADGKRVVIDGATVVADTVFGFAEGGEGLVIPAKNVQEIRVKKLSLLKSAIIPAGLAASAVSLFVLVRSSTSVPDPVDTVQSSVPDPYAP